MRERSLEFPPDLWSEVKKQPTCDSCNRYQKVEVHHCIPINFIQHLRECNVQSHIIEAYKDLIKSRENAAGLCKTCHPFYDKLAEQGIFFGFGKVGIQ